MNLSNVHVKSTDYNTLITCLIVGHRCDVNYFVAHTGLAKRMKKWTEEQSNLVAMINKIIRG